MPPTRDPQGGQPVLRSEERVFRFEEPVFRFAPSPNGRLHLGHALSALLNHDLARAAGGRLLVRLEDIDAARCTPVLAEAILEDLRWLGVAFEEPVRRQSDHMAEYAAALRALQDRELVYPAFVTRGETRRFAVDYAEREGRPWPSDPDGAPLYPALDRDLTDRERQQRIAAGEPHSWRLDMGAALAHVGAPLGFEEHGSGSAVTIEAAPALWGDVVLARSDVPTSYHLAVTLDDALQGVTDVVRGVDLLPSTAVHRLLQHLLGLPVPRYHHHRLLLGEDGLKLSKSRGDTALAALRERGATPAAIQRLVALSGHDEEP